MTKRATPTPAPYELHRPKVQKAPVVIASPHSGRYYPPEFLKMSRLDALALRQSEDSYVDEIMGFATALGLPLLAATYPRAFVDLNREAYELDPEMFAGTLPLYARNVTDRAKIGFGTVPRVISAGINIYDGPLEFDYIKPRIDDIHTPYHDTLKQLVDDTHKTFGEVLLIDAHSMPSQEGPNPTGGFWKWSGSSSEPDMVIGDRFSTSCDPAISAFIAESLMDLGYTVHMNAPYAGGFTTRTFGQPHRGLHALQIEIRRDLYMDEATRVRETDALSKLAQNMKATLTALIESDLGRGIAQAAQ